MNRQIDFEALAKKYVGNWKSFNSFGWLQPEDSDNCAIIYTSNRDSNLMDQSNAHIIAKAMKPYLNASNPMIETFSANHWACGYVDGYVVRVYTRKGKVTKAFKELIGLVTYIAEEYPLLDESHHSELVHEEAARIMKDNEWENTEENWDKAEQWAQE